MLKFTDLVKECPFCGSKNISKQDGTMNYKIKCNSCDYRIVQGM